jgi:hypothetical protein
MSGRLTALLTAGGIAAFASPASAHIRLRAPLQRYADLKDGPCGLRNGTRTENVCTLRPGANIIVVWDETINHPGHFRISFDDDGDDDFVDPAGFDDLYTGSSVLLDGIPDQDGDSGYRQELTLPDIECDNCTLQVIQVMTDKAPYGDGNDLYYQCADLVLSSSAPAEPAPGCSDVAGGGDAGPDDSDDDAGGCWAAGSGGSTGWLVAVLLAVLLIRRAAHAGSQRRRP